MKFSLIVEVTPLTVHIKRINPQNNAFELLESKNFSRKKLINNLLTNYELNRYLKVFLGITSKYLQETSKFILLISGHFEPLFVLNFCECVEKDYAEGVKIVFLGINRLKHLYSRYIKPGKVLFIFYAGNVYIGYYSKFKMFNEFGDISGFLEQIIKYDIVPHEVSEIVLCMDPEYKSTTSFNDFIKSALEYFPLASLTNVENDISKIYLLS